MSESDRLAHLIENVMAYSRLENRLVPRRDMAQLNLDELVQQSMPMLRRRVEQAGLLLNMSVSDGGVRCRTDPVAVGQVLINLVDNACKYGQSAIEMVACVVAARVEIRVSDRGSGIPPEQAGRLFLAFSKSKTDSVPGIGLGLFVSRQLARNLGGELEYRATERGATFVLMLPI